MEVEFKKTIIYKVYDKDEVAISEKPKYFTLSGLRHHVINELWVNYDDTGAEPEVQEFSQVELLESDERIFYYLNSWGFQVDRIIVFDTKEVYTTTN
jgi:hypothetical protein